MGAYGVFEGEACGKAVCWCRASVYANMMGRRDDELRFLFLFSLLHLSAALLLASLSVISFLFNGL
jgi:hypothetical protein